MSLQDWIYSWFKYDSSLLLKLQEDVTKVLQNQRTMNQSRRSFFSALSALPLVGWMFGRAEADTSCNACPPITQSEIQMTENRNYYRGLVTQIGELFGVESRISDDGSVQDDVLCAKVPELVQRYAIRWIPVTERLPELDRMAYGDGRYGWSREVLVLCKGVRQIGTESGSDPYGPPMDAVGFGHRWREGATGIIHWVAACADNAHQYRDVTHWAELPAPPETQS